VWIGTGAATKPRVLKSSDGGNTWTVADTPLAASASSGIFSVAFRDAGHGMVVGGDYKNEAQAENNAAVTSDGGATWTAVKGLGGFRSAVSHNAGATPSWIAIGPTGSDLSTDDGHTWKAIPGPGYHAFGIAPRGNV